MSNELSCLRTFVSLLLPSVDIAAKHCVGSVLKCCDTWHYMGDLPICHRPTSPPPLLLVLYLSLSLTLKVPGLQKDPNHHNHTHTVLSIFSIHWYLQCQNELENNTTNCLPSVAQSCQPSLWNTNVTPCSNLFT